MTRIGFVVEDCDNQPCLGVAFFDSACKSYVCDRCNNHNGKSYCVKCGWDKRRDCFDKEEDLRNDI